MEKLERFGSLVRFTPQDIRHCLGHGYGEWEPQLTQAVAFQQYSVAVLSPLKS